MNRSLWTAAAAVLLLAGTALAGTPAQNCESSKNKEAANYIRCRQKAEATFALTHDDGARTRALGRCAGRHGEVWPRIESRADGACPSSGDQTTIQQYLDTASKDVAKALAGGTPPARGHRLKTGQTQCFVGGSHTPVPCGGTGRDGEFQKGLDRGYVDNGDGTITDTRTGLMWEKLSWDGSIHDRINEYSWPDGYLVKVAALNAIAFAGHTDWRMPNVNELQSLVNYGVVYPAVSPPFHSNCSPGCTVLTCSCGWSAGFGGSEIYWSSTTAEQAPFFLWTIRMYDGTILHSARNELRHVRAVRGGS
jgi:hypothetical protein